MRIAICEDNAADAAEIRAYIERHFARHNFSGEIELYDSGEALLAAFTPGAFDVVFLDIYLDGINGVEVAQQIRADDPDCALVFITIDPGYMPAGFALRAASYVVKPITPEQMDTALLQCRSVFQKNARYLEVKTGGQSHRIPLTKVLYVETQSKATTVVTAEGAFKTYTPIETVARQLGGSPFLRCHRSFIVNLNQVTDLQENDFLMKNGAKVPVRKNGLKEIRRIVSEFFSQRLFEEI